MSSGGRSGHFGKFVATASELLPEDHPKLKTPDQFRLIGKDLLPRKDSADKTNGSAIFTIDVKVPGMVYVAIRRSPKFGGKVKTVDADKAGKIPGFIDAKTLPAKAGVAVYAKDTWAAFKARDALEGK